MKQKQIEELSQVIDLITQRIDGCMADEKELARANRILCRLLKQLRKEIKP